MPIIPREAEAGGLPVANQWALISNNQKKIKERD
jgi:hypothetical protein